MYWFKKFFASVECVERNLDPFTTPLIVADPSRKGGAITLAVTPYMKTLGVPSRGRVLKYLRISNILLHHLEWVCMLRKVKKLLIVF